MPTCSSEHVCQEVMDPSFLSQTRTNGNRVAAGACTTVKLVARGRPITYSRPGKPAAGMMESTCLYEQPSMKVWPLLCFGALAGLTSGCSFFHYSAQNLIETPIEA